MDSEAAKAADTAVEPIPLRKLRPWALLAIFLYLVLYLVAFDQGGISQAGAFLHEAMHDGRHLLAVPCH
jgi:Probable cobalt transporter subunit (CbtB)